MMEESARSGHIPAKERAAADNVLCIHLESEKKKREKEGIHFYQQPYYFAKTYIHGPYWTANSASVPVKSLAFASEDLTADIYNHTTVKGRL